MIKALVTGFEPWGREKYNPTEDVAKALDGKTVYGVKIYGYVLPVSFRKVMSLVPKLIDEVRPQIVVHTGLAPGASSIRIERVAVNLMDAKIKDNDGFKPRDETINPEGPAAYFSTLPTRKIFERMRKSKIPSVLSYTAGTFVCNCTFYTSLDYISRNGLNTIAGFIHVPCVPQQVVGKPETPSMDLKLILMAVKTSIGVSKQYLKRY